MTRRMSEELESHGGSMASQILTGVGSLALGVGLMYVLDPRSGTRRRSIAQDKMIHAGHVTSAAARKTARYMQGRMRGVVAEARGRLAHEPVADDVLCARVRSAMGRAVSNPGAIAVSAREGVVTLHGPVLADEVHNLLATIEAVRGVSQVVDQLEVHEQVGEVPGLQRRGPMGGRRYGPALELWPPTTRLAVGLVGGSLISWGLAHRRITGLLAGLIGTGLLARALTNLSARRLTGLEAGPRAVDVQKTITIVAPIERVFEFFSNYQNFPYFMRTVREVREHAGGRSHWAVLGPAGVEVHWEADIVQYVPDRIISWRSVPGAAVENAGTMRFDPVPEGTRLDIKLSYNPPGGALGHAIARLFGADPKSEMDEDLMRVKTLLETGNPAHDAARSAERR